MHTLRTVTKIQFIVSIVLQAAMVILYTASIKFCNLWYCKYIVQNWFSRWLILAIH